MVNGAGLRRIGRIKTGLGVLLFGAMFWLTATDLFGLAGFRLIELDGNNVKWGSSELGTPARVSVGFADHAIATPGARNCREVQPLGALLEVSGIEWERFRSEVRLALDAWEKVAGIHFDLVDRSDADILIGAQVRPRGRAFANVSQTDAGAAGLRPLSRSIVCLNPTRPWKIGFDGRLDVYDLRYTIAHEIGHAIGLNHPGPSGQLMSFQYREEFRSPQSGDISGATLLYGPPNAR